MDAQNGYFSDAAAPEDPMAAEKPVEEPSDTNTALIPIDFFQGKELTPGSTCTIRVAQVMDDQVSVEYVGSEGGEEEMEMEEAAVPAGAEAESPDMFG